MKALILYFSGTGNTKYTARYLQKRLANLSVDSDLRSIENILPKNCVEFDLLIMGFPVYAGAPPGIFQQFINSLPVVNKKGIFVFCTRAMFTGRAIANVFDNSFLKGYIPLGHQSIGMPGSDGLPFLSKKSKYVQRALKKDYSNLSEIDIFADKIVHVINEINQGKSTDSLRKQPPKDIPLLSGFFQLIWNLGYKFAEKKIKPNFWVDEKCTNCELCIKQCPAKNISMKNGFIIFDAHCYICMRCINQCPREAIQIGKGTINKFRWKGPTGDFKPECN